MISMDEINRKSFKAFHDVTRLMFGGSPPDENEKVTSLWGEPEYDDEDEN